MKSQQLWPEFEFKLPLHGPSAVTRLHSLEDLYVSESIASSHNHVWSAGDCHM